MHQTLAETAAGTIVIRLHQNRDGVVLPPDLGSALRAPNTVEKGKLITLLDIDHFHVCDSVEYSDVHLENVGWKLKSGAFDVFADHVVCGIKQRARGAAAARERLGWQAEPDESSDLTLEANLEDFVDG